MRCKSGNRARCGQIAPLKSQPWPANLTPRISDPVFGRRPLAHSRRRVKDAPHKIPKSQSTARRTKTRRRKGVAKIPKSEFSDFGIVFRGNRRSGCRPEIGRVLSRSPSEPQPILANLDPQISDPAFGRRAPPKQATATSGDAAPRGCVPSFKFRASEIPNMIFRRSGFPRFLRSNRGAGSAPDVGPQLRGSRLSGLSFPAPGPPQIRRRAPRVPGIIFPPHF